MTAFMQRTLRLPPLHGGLVFLPLALTFVVASGHSVSAPSVAVSGGAIQSRRSVRLRSLSFKRFRRCYSRSFSPSLVTVNR